METQLLAGTIGNNVKSLRASKGYTIERCAELIGVSARELSNIEHGKAIPTLKTICNICYCFDISIEYLITQKLFSMMIKE